MVAGYEKACRFPWHPEQRRWKSDPNPSFRMCDNSLPGTIAIVHSGSDDYSDRPPCFLAPERQFRCPALAEFWLQGLPQTLQQGNLGWPGFLNSCLRRLDILSLLCALTGRVSFIFSFSGLSRTVRVSVSAVVPFPKGLSYLLLAGMSSTSFLDLGSSVDMVHTCFFGFGLQMGYLDIRLRALYFRKVSFLCHRLWRLNILPCL